MLAEAEAQLADRRYLDRLAKEEELKRFVPNRRQQEQERLDKLAKKEETKQRSEEAIGELRDAAAAEKEATQFSLKAIRALKEERAAQIVADRQQRRALLAEQRKIAAERDAEAREVAAAAKLKNKQEVKIATRRTKLTEKHAHLEKVHTELVGKIKKAERELELMQCAADHRRQVGIVAPAKDFQMAELKKKLHIHQANLKANEAALEDTAWYLDPKHSDRLLQDDAQAAVAPAPTT